MNETMIAARVIARLKVMYPAYARMMDNDPDMMALALDEWATSLQGITLENISQGFEKLRSEGSSYCPSIPEFIKHCGGKPKPWWETWPGITDRGAKLGIFEENFNHRPQSFRLAVLAKARESGEHVPLANDEKEKEALPEGVLKLTKGMKVG